MYSMELINNKCRDTTPCLHLSRKDEKDLWALLRVKAKHLSVQELH